MPCDFEIFSYDTLDSTMLKAQELLQTPSPVDKRPFAVLARSQTQGRGRQGRPWISPVGNLYTSVVLPIHSSEEPDLSNLTFVSAIALWHSLQTYIPPETKLYCKWPNDLLVENRKISGILLQAETRLNQQWIIIGVGVNIEKSPHSYGISLKELGIKPAHDLPQPRAFLDIFLKNLQFWLKTWRQNGFRCIKDEWIQRTFDKGTLISARLPGKEGHHLQGVFQGLDERGVLILKDSSGTDHYIQSGDVMWERTA